MILLCHVIKACALETLINALFSSRSKLPFQSYDLIVCIYSLQEK